MAIYVKSLLIGTVLTIAAVHIFAYIIDPSVFQRKVVVISLSNGLWSAFGVFFLIGCSASYLVLRRVTVAK